MIPEEDLIAEIKRLSSGNAPPTKREFDDNAEYSSHTVKSRFGSWNNAVETAGYSPNMEYDISDETLLKQLQVDVSGHIAPPVDNFNGKYAIETYKRHFGSWWQAVVRTGLTPHTRRPLSPSQYRRFFEAAKNKQRVEQTLTGLLVQFTGLTGELIPQMSESWLTTRAGEVIVKVPEQKTYSNGSWTFRVPESWSDDGQRRETGLPGLLQWYFDCYDSIFDSLSHGNIEDTIYHIADDAGLAEREQADTNIGTAPLIRPFDLRATGGVQMARNSAPTRRISRHLGIKHTSWKATVEDFFLWLYVHEGFIHPDYDPPDVVLDPV